ncbi:hypothetical protein SAMN02745119_00953 [Trichlorobacter thiogenes]|uniref:Uncharacterized protein n=1 Tax=Trichlorobacter thiogenes TaxID=115783 RepID=A0A1T4LLR5_9BACT|nr:DUF5682 family protein [Trichlorobacter thiogenes]SJZ55673.1 hypothetical protein SAMN02745119_00953 [Trichlorobacter thiogenes]
MKPHILGVRHHSPACAQRVVWRINQLQPAFVLIEGPADFNDKLDQLYLQHQLPIAVYSYLSSSKQHHGSWSPFAEHSPEWQALVHGRRVGAVVRFIDLPAWHDAFESLENRYADAVDAEAEESLRSYDAALEKRLAVEGHDALWDHLFEDLFSSADDQLGMELLDSALDTYFNNLRSTAAGSLGNQAREKTMASWIAWAIAQKRGEVVVVCGGYHAAALERLWPQMPTGLPDTPLPEVDNVGGELRYGSFLVPYTFKRLDSFTGYASGMPSPAYYQWLWEGGAEHAGHELLRQIIERLRSRKLTASTADMIFLHSRASGLSRLRGHRQILRIDWLDAIAGALVKDALSVALPWSYRGRLQPGTDPVLVESMDVIAGNLIGKLAPETPQPPLVHSVAAELEKAAIPHIGTLKLDLFSDAGRAKSRLLHKLSILAIPGFTRSKGPAEAMDGESTEIWQITQPITRAAALIEAGAWGATVETAATACLESLLREAENDIGKLASILNRAAFAGLRQISSGCIAQLANAVTATTRFEPLGGALSTLYNLFCHGRMLEMDGAPMLAAVVEAAFDRALWLFELPGAIAVAEQEAHIHAVKGISQICLDLWGERNADPDSTFLSGILPERAKAVFKRKSTACNSAPVSRGASVGVLLALSVQDEAEQELLAEQALELVLSLQPQEMGDGLAGMIALGREQLAHNHHFLTGLNQAVTELDDHDFVVALPAMRGAFTWLPPQERGALAEAVLLLHNASHLSARQLTAPLLENDPIAQANAGLAEKEVIRLLAAWGIVVDDNRGTA